MSVETASTQELIDELRRRLASPEWREGQEVRDGLFELVSTHVASFSTGQLLDLESLCEEASTRLFDEEAAAFWAPPPTDN